jgi:hypothetical protein
MATLVVCLVQRLLLLCIFVQFCVWLIGSFHALSFYKQGALAKSDARLA